jgi:hypothetical protein
MGNSFGDEANINASLFYKGVSLGNSPQNVDSVAFTDTGEALMPYSPAQLRGERTTGNNVRFEWLRRSRLDYDGSFNIGLGEDEEMYEVDFYDEASTLLRTEASVSSEVVNYSSADRIADGASANETIRSYVFQISAVVGRGHSATATA